MTKAELSNTSKHLIYNYLQESTETELPRQARAVIKRYALEGIPSLDSIRQKAQTGELSALDHLVLKMEYEAKRSGRQKG